MLISSVVECLVILAIGVVSLTICCKSYKNESRQYNSTFINSAIENINYQEEYNTVPFQSSIWPSRYFRYGRWHGLHQFPLFFHAQWMKVIGSGFDDIGTFIINGMYSLIDGLNQGTDVF